MEGKMNDILRTMALAGVIAGYLSIVPKIRETDGKGKDGEKEGEEH
ncbi:MAG: hypothetical protein ACI4F3_12655 [Enterocloster sp.]